MASFKEAFSAARKKLGAGKTFEWNGKSYSTNLKEEVSKPASAAPTKSIRPKAKSAAAPKPTKTPAPKQTKAPMTMEEKNVAALKALGSKFLTKTPAGAPNRADVAKKKK